MSPQRICILIYVTTCIPCQSNNPASCNPSKRFLLEYPFWIPQLALVCSLWQLNKSASGQFAYSSDKKVKAPENQQNSRQKIRIDK